jgi:CRP/FNR family transcriptional regulator, anaerobic regulatory protein
MLLNIVATLPAFVIKLIDLHQTEKYSIQHNAMHPYLENHMFDANVQPEAYNAMHNPDNAVVSHLMNPEMIKVACSNCNLRELCMPVGLNHDEMVKLDHVVSTRKRVKQGGHLFSHGDPFTTLYAIRTGYFKTCVLSEDGREQVTGFQMAGEIIGLDGIVSDKHNCNAVALEDAEVCIMPFENVEELSREFPVLQRHVHKIMSREIVRENGVMMLLGNMRAEERLAAFLLNLVQRLHVRGFSQSEFVLRMTREEIGSYLGMKLETVSRTFSKFSDDGIIEVKQRNVKIINPEALKKIYNPQSCA